MGPLTDLDRLQCAVGIWADETFPAATPASILRHLAAEVAECSAARDGPALAEEAADCLLLLLHLAHQAGVSLFDAAVAKHAVNRARTWETAAGPKGYWAHTEEMP